MVTPKFVIEQKEEFQSSMDYLLKQLSKKSANYMHRQFDKPSSRLLGILAEHNDLTNLDKFMFNDRYILNGAYINSFHVGKIPFDFLELQKWDYLYEDAGALNCCLFINSVYMPEILDTEDEIRFDKQPMHRIYNNGFYVHTIEVDPSRECTADHLELMVQSLYKRDADRHTPMERLYKAFAEYHDFRGIEVVWSGHKSFHIHLLFDTKHLAPSRFDKRLDRTDSSYDADVPQEYLRKGYEYAWEHVQDTFFSVYQGYGLPDQQLKYAEQYRRLPFGVRIADNKHLLGIPAGNRILQLPVWSKFRSEPQKAGPFLHTKDEFYAANKTAVKLRNTVKRKGKLPMPDDLPDAIHEFIDEVAIMCEEGWGDPLTHPRPAYAQIIDDTCNIYFHNHAGDKNPTSLMQGVHNRLMVNGHTPDPDTSFVLPLTADQLWEKFMRDGSLFEIYANHPRSEIEQEFFDKVNSPEEMRNEISNAIEKSLDHPRLMVFTQEGAGKTRKILQSIPSVTWLHERYVLFSCRSYKQAYEKRDEFEKLTGIQAEVLLSFSQQYQDLENTEGITYEKACLNNENSFISAINTYDREAWQTLETQKREMWSRLRKQPVKVIFTVHAVAKQWHHHGGTRFWMHPQYGDWLRTKDHDLHRKIMVETEAGWVISDEVEVSDLINMHSQKAVAWCHDLASNAKWRDVSKQQRLHAYQQKLKSSEIDLDFSEVCAIIELHYNNSHRLTVDTSLESFGISNTEYAPYACIHGDARYVKPCDWWSRFSSSTRVTILTTEHRPKLIMEALNKKAIEDDKKDLDKHVFEILSLDKPEVFDQQSVELAMEINELANRQGIDELVQTERQMHPDAEYITNHATKISGVQAISHQTAKGNNDYVGKDVTAIYTYLSPEQYADLLIENAITGRSDMVRLFYVDMFNQTSGRSLGFRHSEGTHVKAIMSPRLWKELEYALKTHSRYKVKTTTRKKKAKAPADLAA